MATVTGMTAAAMIAIRDQTIIDAVINGSGHLILTRHDESTIDAGSITEAVDTASDTVAGVVELATSAETLTGTDATRAVTPAGLLSVASTKQPLDEDLTAIANIAPADDDFIQRKSGVWVNRTLAQLATDLIATSSFASSDTQKGIVELATNAEVVTGTDTTRAVTPAGLTNLTASDTQKGIVELATNAEVVTGTDTARAVTPSGLANLTASATQKGIVELATDAETATGTDTTRAVTPAGLESRLGLLPKAMASGTLVITPVANTPTSSAVTFPVGRFSSAPHVLVSLNTTVPGTQVTGWSSANITSSGFDAYVTRTNTTNTTLYWTAVLF